MLCNQAKLDRLRQRASSTGLARPLDANRSFYLAILGSFDTAVRAETRKFVEELGGLGAVLGRDLLQARSTLARFGFARHNLAPIDPSLLQWLQSAPGEAHEELGDIIRALMSSDPVSVVRGNAGRAQPRAAHGLSAKLRTAYQQRKALITADNVAKLGRLSSPIGAAAQAALEQEVERILEYRDAVLLVIYKSQRGKVVADEYDGKSVKEFISDGGLAKSLIGAQLQIRRIMNQQLLPVSPLAQHHRCMSLR